MAASRRAATSAKQMTKIVANAGQGAKSLSREERDAYRAAKQSVVDARRKAPSNEGRLQIS
jgi:hypothetical protein